MNFFRPILKIEKLTDLELNNESNKLAKDIFKVIKSNKDLYDAGLDFSNVFEIYQRENVIKLELNKALLQVDSIYGMNNFIKVVEEEDIYKFLKISETIYQF